MAVEMLEREKCSKCGVPAWLAYSEDSTLGFDLDHIDCYACAHKERIEEERSKREQKDGKKDYGRTYYPVPKLEEGFDRMPTRADFVAFQAKKASKSSIS